MPQVSFAQAESTEPPRTPQVTAYSYYVLAVLVLMNLFNFVDRQIVSVLLQQVKDEFLVSDEWLGLLSGMAFVVVHAVMGIPIARWADRGSRRDVIALGVFVWSALTALSGAARSFGTLVVLRAGVGIGEAAGTPPAHSLISDYFPPERRARALSIFAMGLYAGIMFGYLVAGWVGEHFGWRMTFVVVGLPGIALAALVFFTVREPERQTTVDSHPIGEVARYLFARPAYVCLLVAASVHAAAGYSIAHWGPTFLVRVHDFSYAEVGTALGLLTGLAGAAGALFGGRSRTGSARATGVPTPGWRPRPRSRHSPSVPRSCWRTIPSGHWSLSPRTSSRPACTPGRSTR